MPSDVTVGSSSAVHHREAQHRKEDGVRPRGRGRREKTSPRRGRETLSIGALKAADILQCAVSRTRAPGQPSLVLRVEASKMTSIWARMRPGPIMGPAAVGFKRGTCVVFVNSLDRLFFANSLQNNVI